MQSSILRADQNKAISDQFTYTASQALITRERAQKLELLVHLVNNLTQPLILCGAEGIGKSFLLKTFIENYSKFWSICLIDTSVECSFDIILGQFLQQLQIGYRGSRQSDLTNILVFFQKKNIQAVLIIDNAGSLVPGIANDLIRFAAANPCVRLIFSLTYDELHIMRSSDACIDACHVIEIPPLNHKQCVTFLQSLSTQYKADMPLGSVNDELAEKLFRSSHGIPGKIIQQIQRSSDEKIVSKNFGRMALLVVLGMIVLCWVVYLFTPNEEHKDLVSVTTSKLTDTNKKMPERPLIDLYQGSTVRGDAMIGDAHKIKEPVFGPLASGFYSSRSDDMTETVALSAQPNIQSSHKAPKVYPFVGRKSVPGGLVAPVQPLKEDGADSTAVKLPDTSKAMTAAKQKNEKKSIVALTDDINLNWLKKQKPDNYTLQLMVLSNKAAALDLLKKYSALQDKIRYFMISQGGRSRYLLIYHTFSSSKDAFLAKKLLPRELRNVWVRNFKGLQRQLAVD